MPGGEKTPRSGDFQPSSPRDGKRRLMPWAKEPRVAAASNRRVHRTRRLEAAATGITLPQNFSHTLM
jgi:hypothetical protein